MMGLSLQGNMSPAVGPGLKEYDWRRALEVLVHSPHGCIIGVPRGGVHASAMRERVRVHTHT